MPTSGTAVADLTDPATDDGLGSRRAEVLGRLRVADEPLTVQQVAAATGVHLSTARFHLDGLVGDGLAERRVEIRETPGRPRMLYVASAAASNSRSYRLLAEMLTGLVASLDGARSVAQEAGRAWGRHLVDRPAPSARAGSDEALLELNRLLQSLGFQPQTSDPDAEGRVEIRLGNCPFREVALQHPDVVCGLHLGVMQGALREWRVPVTARSLKPFVAPNLCIAHLRVAAKRTRSKN